VRYRATVLTFDFMAKQSPARFLSRYVPLIGWLIFISIASSNGFSASNTSRIIEPLVLWLFPNTTADQLATIHFLTRKLAHFTEYAILALLAARAFWTSPSPTLKRQWFWISLALIVVYALIDEYHQSFVPSRTASIGDSFIDMAGGLTALLVLRTRLRSQP
jgi:VanZ family protein